MASPKPAAAQEALCMGQVMVFGGNFCPRSWLPADGTLLPINSYQALYSILGTMYGGDGRTTFALPDLRNRTAVHVGTGPGVGSSGTQGTIGGTTSFSLTQSTMPAHTPQAYAAQAPADNQNPNGDLLGGAQIYVNNPSAGLTPLASNMIGNSGGGQPVSKRSPYQVLRYCVAAQGIFCSRN